MKYAANQFIENGMEDTSEEGPGQDAFGDFLLECQRYFCIMIADRCQKEKATIKLSNTSSGQYA